MSRWGIVDQSLEGRSRVYFPHFSEGRVPLDAELNARFRRRWFLTSDESERALIRKWCSEDFLFWAAGFASLFDAGDESGCPGAVPFIPYEYQVEVLTVLWSALHVDRCSVRLKKPRRLGATWMVIMLLNHCWQFMANRHILVGSHREEEVDGSAATSKGGLYVGEWSRLLPKFDFLHIHQPPWLLPPGYVPRTEPYRTRMKIMNPSGGSMIWGTSASSTAAHGERGYACFWDEAALTENLYDIIAGLAAFAPCKLWVSTINNLDHPFSTTLKDAPGVVQVEPHWWMHPDYSKDMEIDVETGKRTSPWLRKKLAEINYDALLSNRLYFADETQQLGGYYGPEVFRTLLGTMECGGTVMDPLHVGEMDLLDDGTGVRVTRFIDQAGGRWKLWFNFDAQGRPPRGTQYLMGVDVAAGTTDWMGRGATNSVICLVDWQTGEVVAELATHTVKPYELAAIAAAVGRWFEGEDFMPARINFERNGPGAEFGEELVKKHLYGNVYREDRMVRETPGPKYGWWRGPEEGRLGFGLHRQMICEGTLKERSMDCAVEMRHYQHNPSGKGGPIHSASLYSEDPSGARENHGDRVVARVVICQLLRNPYRPGGRKGTAPWGSYRYLKEKESARSWEAELV